MLKLDGNEGARPPAGLLEILAGQSLDALRDYPDTRDLEARIAELLGVTADRIVVTAGADDALDRLCRACLWRGRRMVLPVPAFEMLYRFAAVAGGEIDPVPWVGAFPTDGVIAALGPDVSLVAITSPNNPTGRVVGARDLERVAAAASEALVLLDNVYGEYSDEDLTAVAAELENVVTVRSFSKAWGLAGCRVGYALATPDVAAILRNAGNPFPVAGLSVVAVGAQLNEGRARLDKHVLAVRSRRERLTGELAELGAAPHPSQANFVFADLGARAEFVHQGLASLGVRVRRFSHRPEIATGLRITVPESDADEARLFGALRTVLDPEALLFDMDGVLADVEGSYRRCLLEMARAMGASVTRSELDRLLLAGDANNDWVLAQRILADQGIDASLEEVTARFQELYLGTEGVGGLREAEEALVALTVLERLAERLTLGIVTGRPRDEAEWFLDRHDLRRFFRVWVCMEDGPLKPDPEPVRLALSRLEVSRAWMVGDTPDDLRAAAGAGVVPLGIAAPGTDPVATATALLDAGAAVVLDLISDLEALLP